MTGHRFGERFGDTELADAFDGSDRGPVQYGSGLYLTDMADVLRDAGLTVTEQDGWRTRSRSSGGYTNGRPWCVMWHHAASSPGSSAENVADYASYGSDVAPVCNLVLGRDGAVIVCAAGATNTNGTGGPHQVSRGTIAADTMNTNAIGIEAVNSGVGEPWPQVQIDAYFLMTAALLAAYGLAPDDVCTHAQWAPGRKIDPAVASAVQGPWRPGALNSSGTWSLMDIKAELRARAERLPPQPHPTPTPPPQGDDMPIGPFFFQSSGAGTIRHADGSEYPAYPGAVFYSEPGALWFYWLTDELTLNDKRFQVAGAGYSDAIAGPVDNCHAYGFLVGPVPS